MELSNKSCPAFLTLLVGIALVVMGIIAIICQPLVSILVDAIHQRVTLVEGNPGFDTWATDQDLSFELYAFDVTNPEGVMQGEVPKLVERGPYVYDEQIHKNVLRHDEELDEIEYTVTRTFHFNQKKSGNCTENDELAILNFAYMGTMNTLATLPSTFMTQYGDNIAKLFPDPTSIFVKGKAKDIFFSGMRLSCDTKKYPELSLICNTLKGRTAPIMWSTDKEGVYLYSFFKKINATVLGPFTVNRGVKDLSRLGDVTSFRGKRTTKYWRNKTCNVVRGTDTVTWAPMDTRVPRAYSFVDDACRFMYADYKDEVVINGILGWRYALSKNLWDPENIDCYCPVVKKEVKCLPRGLLDISKCQEGPVIASEPNFLHGDPELLSYATGLKPREESHFTFIVIDPLTGAPLHGSKKIQLNMKLSNLPVELLANVSEGYFPMIWCNEGGVTSKMQLKAPYQCHRMINLFWFLQCTPAIIGGFVIFASVMLSGDWSKSRTDTVTPITGSILIQSHGISRNVTGRSQPRPGRMFE